MESIMKKYSYLHELERGKDDFKKDLDIANFLETDYDKLDKKDKLTILSKIVEENKLDKELLRYMIKNSEPKKETLDIKTFLNKINRCLKRFHRKAGGFHIEDDVWGYTREKTYKTGKIKYVLTNTIDVLEGRDREIHEYLTDLVNYLNKLSQFKVSYKLKEDDQYKISYIYIVIE